MSNLCILDVEIQDVDIQDVEIQDVEIQDVHIQDVGILDVDLLVMERSSKSYLFKGLRLSIAVLFLSAK